MRFRHFASIVCGLALLAGCASTPERADGSVGGSRGKTVQIQGSAEQKQKFAQALADIQSGELEKAQTTLSALVAEQPGLTGAQNNLGVVYRRQGEFKQAERAYRAALTADPNNAEAHLNLGILYDVYLQQPAQALTHYETYQTLSAEQDKEVALWIADLKQRL